MRRLSYLSLLLTLIPAIAMAQSSPPPQGMAPSSYQSPTQRVGTTDFTALVGWQYWGTRPYYGTYYSTGGDVHLNANVNYGGELTAHVRPFEAIQLSYTYQSTDLVLQGSAAGGDYTIAKTSVQYIQVYGVREMPKPNGITPFVKGGMGATVFSPSGYGSQWLFSLGLGFGIEKTMNEKVSLKLTQRFLVPIQWTSGGFYFGTGGSGVSVGGGSSIIQGDTSLGLTFKLGK